MPAYLAKFTGVDGRLLLAAITTVHSGSLHNIHAQLPKLPYFAVFDEPSKDMTNPLYSGETRALKAQIRGGLIFR